MYDSATGSGIRQTIEDIRNGNTNGARNSAIKSKAIFAAAQAALGVAAGGLSANYSKEQAQKKTEKDQRDQEERRQKSLSTPTRYDVPDWFQKELDDKKAQNPEKRDPSAVEAGKSALAAGRMNDEANKSLLSVNGNDYSTPEAIEATIRGVNSEAGDLATSKELIQRSSDIQRGGMSNSQVRRNY